jgi:hypothetical protein
MKVWGPRTPLFLDRFASGYPCWKAAVTGRPSVNVPARRGDPHRGFGHSRCRRSFRTQPISSQISDLADFAQKVFRTQDSGRAGPICQRVPLLGSCGDRPAVGVCYGEASRTGLWTWPSPVAAFRLSRFRRKFRTLPISLQFPHFAERTHVECLFLATVPTWSIGSKATDVQYKSSEPTHVVL